LQLDARNSNSSSAASTPQAGAERERPGAGGACAGARGRYLPCRAILSARPASFSRARCAAVVRSGQRWRRRAVSGERGGAREGTDPG
jgi:hypothetical protein